MSCLIDTVGSPRRTAIILATIGLAVRLGLAIWLGLDKPPDPGSDQQEYDTYAWNLAQGRGYRGMSPDVADQDHLTAYRVPGTSLVWAGLYSLFGHRYDVIRIFHSICGAVAVWLTYAIGCQCYNERVGLISAAVYVLFPTSLVYTVELLSEPLGTMWFLAFVWIALRFAAQPSWIAALISGIFLGLSILTRPNSIFMMPLLVVWGGWQFRRQRRAILQVALILILPIGFLLPWVYRNYRLFHTLIPLATSGGSGLLQGNNDLVVSRPELYGYSVWDSSIVEYRDALRSAGDEVERDKRARDFAIEWIRKHPDKWWYLIRAKLCRSMTPFLQPNSPRIYQVGMLVAWGPVFLLSSLAFFPSLIGFLRKHDPGWLLHLAIVHYLFVSVVFYAVSRYRQPVEPLCIIVAVWSGIAGFRWTFLRQGKSCLKTVIKTDAGE